MGVLRIHVHHSSVHAPYTYMWDLLVKHKWTFVVISFSVVAIVLVHRSRKSIFRTALGVWKWWGNNLRKENVKVFCEDNAAEYAKCFEYYIKREFDRSVEWHTPGANADDIAKGKYLLIFDVKNRMPEDYRFTLVKLGLTGRTLGNNILVVAMHRSHNGNKNDFYEFTSIDTTDYDLYSVNPISIYYSRTILSAEDNKKAHQTIKRFLSF
uniref:Uncharacterized protein LOC111105825 isoform X2 n=1 Tax=Crassostrea virginica TaxID=6565 RepID=A0A8B8AYV5_CRAVI|nr:uncharacterized protein LOC111105825 isoform X2 [Crassostrea virginica]